MAADFRLVIQIGTLLNSDNLFSYQKRGEMAIKRGF